MPLLAVVSSSHSVFFMKALFRYRGLALVNWALFFDIPVQASCNALEYSPIGVDYLAAVS